MAKERASDDAGRLRELRAFFDAVVELPEAERRGALERLAGADRARVEEVLALLRAAEQGDGFLEPPPAARPGARVGRFALERVLRAGRVGTVHLARDARDGTPLALRVVPLDEDELEPVARLRRSARILATVDHPALARTLETGLCAWPEESGRSALYFASELVSDATPLVPELGGACSAGSLELFLDACDALAHAHADGALHGALTSANVLVDLNGRVHVLDLGVRMVFPDPERPPSAAGDRIALAELLAALLARLTPDSAPWHGRARELARRAARPDAGPELASVGALAARLRSETAR